MKRNTRGASMAFALIVMLVFLIVGVSVLTAASGTLAAGDQRIQNRETYFSMRSTLDVLDEALQNGELGTLVRDRALAALGEEDTATVSETLTPTVTLNSDELNCTVTDVTLAYSGRVDRADETGVAVSLPSVVLSFRVTGSNNSYAMRATYRYHGWATQGEEGWKWDEQWNVETIG